MGQPLPRREVRPSATCLALLALAVGLLSLTPASEAIVALDRADPGRPAMRTFVDRDGLPQNSALDLAFDAKGYLWAATQAGAARYNGHTWTVVNMPRRNVSNYVRAVLPASDGSVWFGTDGGGVARLLDGQWTTYDASSDGPAGSLPHNRVTDLLETKNDDGSPVIWATTQGGGLARFADGRWTTIDERSGLPSNRALCLLATAGDGGTQILWVGTAKGLAKFERGAWSTYDTASALPGASATCLLESDDGRGNRALWVGTGSGLAKLEHGVWTSFTKAAGDLPDDQMQVLAETSGPEGKRTIWLGTEGGGLIRLDPETNQARQIPGLDIDIASLVDTKSSGISNTLWVGTNGGGLVRLKLGKWVAYDRSTGLPDDLVRSFAETVLPDGTSTMWIGTSSGGLASLAPNGSGTWTVYDSSSGLRDDYVLSLLSTTDDDGTPILWVGTQRGGLVRFAYGGGRWSIRDAPRGLPASSVRCLLESRADDGSRTLWAASGGNGIARLENGRWTVYDDLPNNDVRVLLETTSSAGGRTLWAGTAGGGLARFDGGQRTIYDMSTGLANNSVRSLLEVTGADGRRTLWVGTYGGVSRLDLDAPGAFLTPLSDVSAPALPDNTVYQLRKDARGRIYVFTNKGVSRLVPRTPTPDDPSEFSIYTYTTDDGLPGNECNAGASFVDSRGRVWAGTVGGAAVFDPALEIDPAGPGPLYVERVRVGDADQPTLEGRTLAHDENNVDFEFALLSYFRESETRYRTELAGFDGGPTEWTAEHRRTVTNLPAGEYEFRVWARDATGAVSGPVSMSFRVAAAPWQTWWAYLLYLGSVAGLIYLGVRYRLSTLRRRSEELEATVATRTAELADKAHELSEAVTRLEVSEKHALEAKEVAIEASRAKSVFLSSMSHELRTPLNAVIGFAQLMSRDTKLAPEHRQNLSVIHRSGEHLLDLINDVLSISKIEAGRLSLSVKPFDPQKLLQSVRAMTRLRAEEKGLVLAFEIDSGFPECVLGDEGKLRQVLLNLLGNAVKFTDTGGVTLRARWEGMVARFEVEDTGPGIAESELGRLFAAFSQTESGRSTGEGSGLGLVISRNIVRMMGGDLRLVRTTVGRGTLFAFEVSLPAAEGAAAEPGRRVVGLAPGQGPSRILVVDDTVENRLLLVKLLRTIGFEVFEASNGLEAVTAWKEFRPDLIWMDMRMPVMDGREATRRIRAREAELRGPSSSVPGPVLPETVGEGQRTKDTGHRTRIIALTASAFEHERDEFLASGADDMIVKPFREETIFEKIAEHLGVRFLYDEPAVEPPSNGDAPSFTPDRVRRLPPEIVEALRLALLTGDPGAARDAAKRIEPLDEPLAAEILAAVRTYRFDDLLAVVETDN